MGSRRQHLYVTSSSGVSTVPEFESAFFAFFNLSSGLIKRRERECGLFSAEADFIDRPSLAHIYKHCPSPILKRNGLDSCFQRESLIKVLHPNKIHMSLTKFTSHPYIYIHIYVSVIPKLGNCQLGAPRRMQPILTSCQKEGTLPALSIKRGLFTPSPNQSRRPCWQNHISPFGI